MTAPAVDLKAALARLGGDVDLYRQLYPMFREDAQAMLGRLGDLLAGGQRLEAQAVLHTLKGLAATMGAMGLAAAAEQAEQAMSREASQDDLGLLANAHDAFVQTCCTLEQALPALVAAKGETS